MGFTATEIVGYLGSIGILLSFLMKDMTRLRIINTFGCAFFVLYGILLGNSIPIILTNGIIILINLYYIFKGTDER